MVCQVFGENTKIKIVFFGENTKIKIMIFGENTKIKKEPKLLFYIDDAKITIFSLIHN